MNPQRIIFPLVALCLWVGCATLKAQDRATSDRTIIAAATANAVDSLSEDIAAARIDPRLTVADFLKQTGGKEQLVQTLQRAPQVGGPRFSADGGVCQIQLQISGERVAHALIDIAAVRANRSPIPAEVLARELEQWGDRTFTGVGSSISGMKIQFVRPPPGADDAWTDVGDDARRQAVDAARDDAVGRALDTIQLIPLTPGHTIGDALNIKSFRDSLASWLAARPVRRVEFLASHVVELTLSTPPDEFCDQVIGSARLANLPTPDSAGIAQLHQRFSQLPVVSIGRATASASAPTTVAAPIGLPAQPPAWTEQPLMAEGTADARDSKLKTARIAQSAALDALRATINALPISPSTTIGDAAKRSPAIAQAVNNCLLEARPYHVDYRADGSVAVKTALNPRELWAEIQAAQQ